MKGHNLIGIFLAGIALVIVVGLNVGLGSEVRAQQAAVGTSGAAAQRAASTPSTGSISGVGSTEELKFLQSFLIKFGYMPAGTTDISATLQALTKYQTVTNISSTGIVDMETSYAIAQEFLKSEGYTSSIYNSAMISDLPSIFGGTYVPDPQRVKKAGDRCHMRIFGANGNFQGNCTDCVWIVPPDGVGLMCGSPVAVDPNYVDPKTPGVKCFDEINSLEGVWVTIGNVGYCDTANTIQIGSYVENGSSATSTYRTRLGCIREKIDQSGISRSRARQDCRNERKAAINPEIEPSSSLNNFSDSNNSSTQSQSETEEKEVEVNVVSGTEDNPLYRAYTCTSARGGGPIDRDYDQTGTVIFMLGSDRWTCNPVQKASIDPDETLYRAYTCTSARGGGPIDRDYDQTGTVIFMLGSDRWTCNPVQKASIDPSNPPMGNTECDISYRSCVARCDVGQYGIQDSSCVNTCGEELIQCKNGEVGMVNDPGATPMGINMEKYCRRSMRMQGMSGWDAWKHCRKEYKAAGDVSGPIYAIDYSETVPGFESVAERRAGNGGSILDSLRGRPVVRKSLVGALHFALSNNNPESQVVEVDDNSITDGVELLRFTATVPGNDDIVIEELPIFLYTSVIDSLQDVYHDIYLEVDGMQFTEAIPNVVHSGTVVFDTPNLVIDAGDTVEFRVIAEIEEASQYPLGTTVKAQLRRDEIAGIDAQNATNGNSYTIRQITGEASGNEMALYSHGIIVSTPPDSSVDVVSGPGHLDDRATFALQFEVTAIGDDVYLAKNASLFGTTSNNFTVFNPNQAIVNGLSHIFNSSIPAGAQNILIEEGETATITLTVGIDNTIARDTGFDRLQLLNLRWSAQDNTNYHVYTFNLAPFVTDAVFVD